MSSRERSKPLRGPRPPWVFLAAAALVLGAGGGLALALAHSPGYPSDDLHYKYWTHLVTLKGVTAAYSGSWPQTYAIYGPIPLLFYYGVGVAYQTWVDPSFALQEAITSTFLTYLLKLPGVLFHLLTAALLLRAVTAGWGPVRGLVAAGAYVLNPALLWDLSLWGQPDSIHSLFALAAFLFLRQGHPAWGGGALALAAWSKPQAWVLLPFFFFATWRIQGWGGLVKAGLASLALSAAVVTPFGLAGTLPQLLTLPSTIASVMPVVSANAHNLWWLLLGPQAILTHDDRILDDRIFLGALTYRLTGLLLLGFFALLPLRMIHRHPRSQDLPELGAYTALVLFMTATQIHENHLFLLFPFLSLVWWRSLVLAFLYGLFSLTLLGNLALHDPRLLEGGIGSWPLEELRMANAWANALAFAGWGWALYLRGRSRPGPRPSSSSP